MPSSPSRAGEGLAPVRWGIVEPGDGPALLARHEQIHQVQTFAHPVTELAYLHAAARPQHARVLKPLAHKENSCPYFGLFGVVSWTVRCTDCCCGCGNMELAVPHAVKASSTTATSGIKSLREFVICVPQVM